MKNQFLSLLGRKTEHVVTTFGAAKLVYLPDGRIELQGGQPEDRTAAKEWISLFMHEAVPSFPSR